jgi:hypothetical protein
VLSGKGGLLVPKWRIVTAVSVLLTIGLALGCNGFFVDPVLTGLAVGPAGTIQTGNTIQMSAVGTFDDGKQKKISNVNWGSGTPSVATINSSGLVSGVRPGQTIITGAAETVSASATVTVTLGGLTSIDVTSADGFTSITYGSSEQFVATGTANGKQFNITDSVTWSTNPSSINSVSIDSRTGLLTTTSGPGSPVQFEVIATDPPTGISGQMNFTVRP